MKQFVLHHTDGTSFNLVNRELVCCPTAATQSKELNGTDTVDMTIVSATPLTFHIGDYISIFNHIYVLNQQPTVVKAGKREFQYTLKFESVQYELLDVLWFLPQFEGSDNDYAHDGLTTDLRGFLDNLIWNANRNHNTAVWQLGDYPDDITDVKTLAFEEQNCLAVLQNICEEYKVNFRIDEVGGNRVLNVFKNDTDASSLLDFTFSYGRAGGAYKIERTNIDDKGIVTRLYCYGGSENLGSNYGATKLCLPTSSQSASHKSRSQSFLQAPASLVEKFGVRENVLSLDDIYPQGKFTVGARISQRVIHANIGFDINQYLIGGTEVHLTPQTGNCAGYEFGVNKVEYNSGKPYSGCDSQITINTITDENGYVFPSANAGEAFSIAAGDDFLISGISLPDEFIIAAQNKLQDEGEKYLAEYCIPHVQYAIEIDRNYMKQRLAAMSDNEPFKVGLFVTINDEDLGIDNIATQITAISRDLIDEYNFKITLGESSARSNLQRIVGDLKKVTQKAIVLDQTDAELARLNYQAKQELLQTIFDTEQDIYTEGINPLCVQTTALQVGANSRQFTLQNFTLQPNYNTGTNEAYHNNVYWAAGAILTHQTILDSQGNMRVWTLSGNTVTTLTANSPYYIYAVCSKNGNTGSVLLSTDKIRYDGFNYNTETEDNSNYYFLIGQLSSPLSGRGGKYTRIASMTYGSTTINGSFIQTGRLSANNGSTYFDLDTGEISSSSPIKFKYNGTSNTDLDTLLQSINGTSSTALSTANGVAGTANSALSAATAAQNKVNSLKISNNIVSNLPHHWEVGSTTDDDNNAKNYEQLKFSTNNRLRTKWTYPLKQNTTYTVNISSSFGFCWIKFKNNKAAGWSGWKTGKQTFNTGSEFDSAAFIIRFLDDRNIQTQQIQLVELTVTEGEIEHEFSLSDSDVKFLTGGENLLFNSSFTKDTTGWGNNAEIVTLSGVQCGRIIGEKNKTKAIARDITAIINQYPSGTRFTFSGEVMVTDYSAGTTNPFFRPYFEGTYNGSCMTASIIETDIADRPDLVYPLNNTYFSNINGKGWVKFRYTCYFAQSPSRMNIYLFVRDVSCYLYFRNLKLEVGSVATKWIPANNDIDVLADRALFSALQNSTDISGGLVLTNAICLKAASGAVNSGISGLNATTAGKNPRFWAGGNYTAALNAAADSSMDEPNHTLPILLTDQGYNSNIGIFKVLDGAIAVMKNGQIVRISTAAFSTEQTNYSPSAPFTHTLSSGGRLSLTIDNLQGSHTRDFTGLFSKTANYNITIAQTSVKLNLDETRTTFFSGRCTVTLTVMLIIKAGNKTQTIYTGSITKTVSSVSAGSMYVFQNSETLTVPATSVNNVQITSGNRIQLIATLSSSATGSTKVTSRADYYELAAQMVATNSENNSCFILANGGFECAYSSSQALFFNALNGLFSFRGSNFQINGFDWALTKHYAKSLSDGYIECWRIGALVMLRLNMPKSYSGQTLVPSGYRPISSFTFPLYTYNIADTLYECRITDYGVVTSDYQPNNSNGYGTITYITSNAYPS